MKTLLSIVILVVTSLLATREAKAETVHLHVELGPTLSRCSLLTWDEHGKIETNRGQALDVTFNVTLSNPIGFAMRCNGHLVSWTTIINGRMAGFNSITVNGVERVNNYRNIAIASVSDTTWLVAIPTIAAPTTPAVIALRK